jgi:formimidoylglutamate deiminase
MPSPAKKLFADRALLPGGWAEDVAITLAADGTIATLVTGASPEGADRLAGPIVPAMGNLHSHAFQRAMAGLAEVAGSRSGQDGGDDSFWTWREEMYRTVGLLSSDDVETIAAKLFVEMLKGGFGSVAEFHYLHHAIDGRPYADRAEMAKRIVAAASRVGIALTLLPVFYAHSNFGGAAPNAGQRRFIHDIDGFQRLMQDLQPLCAAHDVVLGLAIHSLRAATPDEIRAVLPLVGPNAPIHIHVAEQQREVEDCIAFSGVRPVDFLMNNAPVDNRWCLIHATHITPDETSRIVRSGAVVGLCPATEANLGDGIFPAVNFLAQSGRFGVGTDSHVATSVAEELRTLEYGQRLRDQRRNRLALAGASVGRSVFEAAFSGGIQAMGLAVTGPSADGPVQGIAPGSPADFVVLDGKNPYIASATGDQILDRWIFAGLDRPVRDVMVGGQWRIRDFAHPEDAAIDADFLKVLTKLAAN